MRNILFVVFVLAIVIGAGWVFFKKDQATEMAASGEQTETEGAGVLAKAVEKSDRPVLEFSHLLITVAAAKLGEKSGQVYGQSGGGAAGTSQNEGLGFSRQMFLFSVGIELKDDETLGRAKDDHDRLKGMIKEEIANYYLEKAQNDVANNEGASRDETAIKQDNQNIAAAIKVLTEGVVGTGSVVDVSISNAMDRE